MFPFAEEMENKRKLTKYKVPGGKRVTLIDEKAMLVFDEYYPKWDKMFYIVPPQLTERDSLFGDDKGYEGEAKIADAFKESKINGIFVANFSSKDQNTILQLISKQTFECDFILLTQDYGLWSVEVCDSSKQRIQESIREKFKQLIKNRKHILKLAKELYGEHFSSQLAKIYNGIVAVPSATLDDFQNFKTTAPWQSFISSSPCYLIEFIGEEQILEPSSIGKYVCDKKLSISSTISNELQQFFATIALVKTSYTTLNLENVLSKKEKREITGAAFGMDSRYYHVILSPEQWLILKELPSHVQVIGEPATGKTELLKAVVHLIFRYNSGKLYCLSPNMANFAEGVNRILYIIFGDKPYLKKSIEDYFSALDKNLQPSNGDQMAFEVHSVHASSAEEICDCLLEILRGIISRETVFILVDECYHSIHHSR